MTQSNRNGNRLDRLESIMLDLAAASVRHDNEFSRINNTLHQIVEQQKKSAEHYEQRFSQNERAIATLTASIQDLRNVVADYIQARSTDRVIRCINPPTLPNLPSFAALVPGN
jgi:chromosome condensin MukBEF ATPase and DNA-binding subunit MukB